MKNKKVVFMGTPIFSVPVLEMLIEKTNVILVVTQEDKKSGRKGVITFSPVKKCAIENNIEVYQPHKIKEEFGYILEKKPDIIITCAYGQIIPPELLYTPKYQAINVHASLLPKYRGGAPIHRAIMNGETKTGITIMYMDEGMDTGDIISMKKIDINNDDNVGILHDKLSILGKELLYETLESIFKGENKRIKQDDAKASLASVITREDEHIDFNQKSEVIYNKVRGLYPFPCSYTLLNDEIIKVCECEVGFSSKNGVTGEIINLYKNGIGVKTKDGEIIIKRLKPSGKNEMDSSSYLNGKKGFLIGEKLC